MSGVSHDALPSVEPDGVNASLHESSLHDPAGKAFTGTDELILQLAGQFAESGDRGQQAMELFELRRKLWLKSPESLRPCRIERHLFVATLQVLERSCRRRRLPLGSRLSGREELVGDVRKGAGHDHRVVGEALLHDANRAPDGDGVRQRRSAELHDDRLCERCRGLSRLLSRYFAHDCAPCFPGAKTKPTAFFFWRWVCTWFELLD